MSSEGQESGCSGELMGKATVKLAARAVVSQDLTAPTGSASDLIHVAVLAGCLSALTRGPLCGAAPDKRPRSPRDEGKRERD